MKFAYEYRTSDNVRHSGVVFAPDRESAFQQLKAQGIRPGRLEEAPGFFNKLFGKGKRWLAIGIMAAALIAILLFIRREDQAVRFACEDRAQLFGDPSVLQKLSRNGWRETFTDAGEAWLARHAIPGKLCDCPTNDPLRIEIAEALLVRKDVAIEILDSDGDELKKMKRIVNGMKREFAAYAANQPDALDYMSKACERCRIEKGVQENVAREIAGLERQLGDERCDRVKVLSEWDRKNATLRSFGLPAIAQPE